MKKETLLPNRKIAQINDSIYLSLVTNMNENHGYFYLNDLKKNRIVCIDSAYNFVRSYGAPGHGPSELSFPNGSQIANKRLFVIDEGHRRINTYAMDGKHVGNIKGPIPYPGRFIIQDSTYFGSLLDNENELPIFKANINGHILSRFGTNKRIVNDLNVGASKTYFLEKFNNQIIAICENDPTIERYSISGQLIESFNYSDLTDLNSYINFSKRDQKEILKEKGLYGIYSFCMNSYLTNNNLYILILAYDELTKETICNQILVFKVTENKIMPSRLFKLTNDNGNNSWYSSFCIFKDKIVAYDALSYELHEFIIHL